MNLRNVDFLKNFFEIHVTVTFFVLCFYNLVPRRCNDTPYRMFTAHQMCPRHTWLKETIY